VWCILLQQGWWYLTFVVRAMRGQECEARRGYNTGPLGAGGSLDTSPPWPQHLGASGGLSLRLSTIRCHLLPGGIARCLPSWKEPPCRSPGTMRSPWLTAVTYVKGVRSVRSCLVARGTAEAAGRRPELLPHLVRCAPVTVGAGSQAGQGNRTSA
jgi:hypothetical protein